MKLVLTEGEYIPLQQDDEGVIRSEVFPGLWLAVPALLEANLAQVLTVLQLGLNALEH